MLRSGSQSLLLLFLLGACATTPGTPTAGAQGVTPAPAPTAIAATSSPPAGSGGRPRPDIPGAERCALLGSMAGLTMEWRQDGESLGSLLSRAETAPDPSWRPVRANLAILAYEEPTYMTAEMQARVVREFANDQEAQCYRDLAS